MELHLYLPVQGGPPRKPGLNPCLRPIGLQMKPKLVRNILIQIEACLRDRAKSFSVNDIKTENSSRSTTYRYIRDLRREGVLEKIGREKYSVSDEFRKEIVEEIR